VAPVTGSCTSLPYCGGTIGFGSIWELLVALAELSPAERRKGRGPERPPPFGCECGGMVELELFAHRLLQTTVQAKACNVEWCGASLCLCGVGEVLRGAGLNTGALR
jgi:hypothetical protein